MIVIPHRVRPGLNKPGGVVATAVVPAYAPVWAPDPSRDVVLPFDAFKKISEYEFELMLGLGFLHVSFSNEIIVPNGNFSRIRLASKTEDRKPNLSILCDTLVAARQIKKGEELICPIDFDQALSWKRRVAMSGGWNRSNNERPCRPTVKGYVRYARKQQLGVR